MQIKTRAAVLVAGTASAVALMAAPAFASPGPVIMNTSGNGSILGGNQIFAPISVPVNVCGNAIAILGIAGAGCEGGASVLGY